MTINRPIKLDQHLLYALLFFINTYTSALHEWMCTVTKTDGSGANGNHGLMLESWLSVATFCRASI